MNNINVPNEIEKVEQNIFDLDKSLLDAAREEVKRKANIKSWTAIVLLSTILAVLLFYLMFTVSGFLKLIYGILCLFGLAGISAGIISDIINESRKKKLNDLDGLRSLSKKIAKKNPELAKIMSDKAKLKQVLEYLREKKAEKKEVDRTKFTPIKPMVPGELRGPEDLVKVLTRVLENKQSEHKL